MMRTGVALVMAVALVALGAAWKKHACCDQCGCQCCTIKVCHVVKETKKVPKTCYGCECEDICVPCKSTLCDVHCECKKDPCTGCCVEKKVYDWIPNCGYVKTRAKLTKREIEVEQTTYKWVVEELCPSCADRCRHGGCSGGGASCGCAGDACCEPGCGTDQCCEPSCGEISQLPPVDEGQAEVAQVQAEEHVELTTPRSVASASFMR